MSSVWTAILPVVVAPVATALVAGYAGRFGSGSRLRRELKEDTDLLAVSAAAGQAGNDLAETISPRLHQLVALTRYPRIVAAELPALVLILTTIAVIPATYLLAENNTSPWYPVAGMVVVAWLGIFVGASWLLLAKTLPARAHDRLKYLEAIDPSLQQAEEDAEVVGLWAWLIVLLFYLTLSCWLGQIVFLGLVAWGVTDQPPSMLVLVICIGGAFFSTAVVFESVTAKLQRQAYLSLWGGLLIEPPGLASRLRGFSVAALTPRPLRIRGRNEAHRKAYESRSRGEGLHGAIVDSTGPTLGHRDMPTWTRQVILHIRDSGPEVLEFGDERTRARLLRRLLAEHDAEWSKSPRD
jgi:hypothetical protein